MAKEGKKAFIFVYCAGHGALDEFVGKSNLSIRQQCMIMNGALNNVYNIEQNCRDICHTSNNNTTVFAAFNLTFNLLSKLSALKRSDHFTTSSTYGIGSYEDLSTPLWVLKINHENPEKRNF